MDVTTPLLATDATDDDNEATRAPNCRTIIIVMFIVIDYSSHAPHTRGVI